MTITLDDINREVEALGGFEAVKADPKTFRRIARKLDKLPPLPGERVQQIMQELAETLHNGNPPAVQMRTQDQDQNSEGHRAPA